MRAVRVVAAAVGALLASWCVIAVWQIDAAKAAGSQVAEWTDVRLWILGAAHWTVRGLPFVLVPFGCGLMVAVLWSLIRLRRIPTETEYISAAEDLRAWVTYSWGVAAAAIPVLLLVYFDGLRWLFAAAGLSVPGGISYVGALHRALEVQRFRRARGQTRVPAYWIAMAGLLLPQVAGLALFTWVARAGKTEPSA